MKIKRRIMRLGVGVFILLTVFSLPLRALAYEGCSQEELLRASGAGEVYRQLDQEAKDLLERAGAGEGIAGGGLDLPEAFQGVSRMLRDKLSAPLKALAALLGICVLSRLAGCFDEEGAAGIVQLIGAAACGVVMAGPVLGIISGCQAVAKAAAGFLTAAVPVYAGLLAASGNPITGSGYSLLAMGAGGAIPVVICGFLLPLVQVYLGVSVATAVSGAKLNKLAGWVYSLGKWVLAMAVTLFTGILSVQTAVNSQADAATAKAAKLALSTGVPIVGGALGDALGAIQNSVHMVKSGVGAFGVLAAVCIFLPAILECVLWSGVCAAGQAAGELFDVGKAGGLMNAFAGTVKMVLGILASLWAVCAVSAAAVVFAGG